MCSDVCAFEGVPEVQHNGRPLTPRAERVAARGASVAGAEVAEEEQTMGELRSCFASRREKRDSHCRHLALGIWDGYSGGGAGTRGRGAARRLLF